MPAPPYSCGTETPSRPSLAMPPRMRSRSKVCLRSFSRMNGATFCAPHSRIDCSSRRCSSERLKSIIGLVGYRWKGRIVSCAPGDVHGRAAAQAELLSGARAVGGDLEMVGAAEQCANIAGRHIRVGPDDLGHLSDAPAK